MQENFSLGIKAAIEESIELKELVLKEELYETLVEVGDLIVRAILGGGKVLLCGNGGSAADAQHLAAEFLVRLRSNVNRKPLPALSLATDTSTITACSNDYKFDDVFSRVFNAIALKNDV